MKGLENLKKWLGAITELGLLLIALAIVVQILFGGTATNFFPVDVVGSLTGIVANLGSNGLAGLIALAVILWLFSNRKLS